MVPTTLGYIKLSDLLTDHASDVCELVRHKSRHVYVRLATGKAKEGAIWRAEDPDDEDSQILKPTPGQRYLAIGARALSTFIADSWNANTLASTTWTLDDLWAIRDKHQALLALFRTDLATD